MLDDLDALKKIDKSNMLGLIESFPEQCSKAAAIGEAFVLPPSYKRPYANVACTGLGGSAIGADIARSYVADEAKMPMLVNRNYTLPAFVSKESLVIVSSYSGNTEETISSYKDARAKGAAIIAITSGGELERLARADSAAVVIIPPGLPPRCALGYSFFPLLKLLCKLGIVGNKSAEIEEAIKVMAMLKSGSVGPAVPASKNISKKIAQNLSGKIPVIYGGQDHIDAVVTRWRGQFAENSKTIGSSHVLPEMNHNEIVGWENPEKMLSSLAVIMLRDRQDHKRTALRMDITKKIIEGHEAEVTEVSSSGTGLLARIFSLVYTGDFASYYLAILNGCDPTPVERITYLKNELAKR